MEIGGTSGRRVAILFAGVLAWVAVVVVLPTPIIPSVAGAGEGAQRGPSTTVTTAAVSTSVDLLVPGDGTEGSESTITTLQNASDPGSDGGLSDGTLIAVVVAGLLLVSLAMGLLTWRYWAATRPGPRGPDPSAPGPSAAG